MAKGKAATGKGKGRGKKAVTKVADAAKEAAATAVEAVEEVAEVTKDVAEGAAAFVDRMTDAQNAPSEPAPTADVTDSKGAEEAVAGPSSVTDEKEKFEEEAKEAAAGVAEAEEMMHVDRDKGEAVVEEPTPGMSMEDRQKKLSELRNRMVRPVHPSYSLQTLTYLIFYPKNQTSAIPPDRTAPSS